MIKVAIRVPLQGNKILEQVLERVNASEEVAVMWEMTNTNALKRMGFSDHGPVHFQIVANIALRMCRILAKHGVVMGIVKEYELTTEHAEVIVVLASIFHDLGMTINRQGHEEYSLFIVDRVLTEILDFLPVREKVIVRAEVQHAIINHRDDGKPKTVEAGIMRVADALDMGEGRSRIPFARGEVNIYSISDVAINRVEISDGGEKLPIVINIYMNNSAGLFQVDELLKAKLIDSGIEKYCEIKAFVEGDVEKKLITEFVVGKRE